MVGRHVDTDSAYLVADLATFAPRRHQSATRCRHVLLSAVGPHLHSRVLTRYALSRLLGCRGIDHPRDLLAVLARRVADAADRRERTVAASLLDGAADHADTGR